MKIHAVSHYVVSLLSHFVHFGSLLSQHHVERLQRNVIEERRLTKTLFTSLDMESRKLDSAEYE